MNIDLSIIIVNYKTPEYLFNCIQSVLSNAGELPIEIIVVDNHSQDKSEHLIKTNFHEVIWVNSGYNAGFSRANNIGIKKARGNYLLLLNSDTVIIEDCLQKSLEYYKNLENENLKPGLLGCKMKDLKETVLFNSNLFFSGMNKIWNANPIKIILDRKKKSTENLSFEEIRTKQHLRNHTAAWIGVAFALFNRKLIDHDNLYMDEDFFMYGEDVEWCFRIAKKGYQHFFYSEAQIYHINCGSSGYSEWKTAQVLISEWLYIYKTRGCSYYLTYLFLIKSQLFIDYLLYLKSPNQIKNKEETRNALNQRKLIKILLKKYAWDIIKKYKTKPSTSLNFLKYDLR